MIGALLAFSLWKIFAFSIINHEQTVCRNIPVAYELSNQFWVAQLADNRDVVWRQAEPGKEILLLRQVPEADGFVEAAGESAAAIRRKGDAGHGGGVA